MTFTIRPLGSEAIAHELKTLQAYFEAVMSGKKTFEARKNDRDFMPGDTLILKEWVPSLSSFTGRTLKRRVSWILYGPAFGVEADHCVMALEPVDNQQPSTCGCGKIPGVEMRVYCDCGKRTGFSTDRKTVVGAWDKWVASGQSPEPVEDGELDRESAELLAETAKEFFDENDEAGRSAFALIDGQALWFRLQQALARHKEK